MTGAFHAYYILACRFPGAAVDAAGGSLSLRHFSAVAGELGRGGGLLVGWLGRHGAAQLGGRGLWWHHRDHGVAAPQLAALAHGGTGVGRTAYLSAQWQQG